jgi:hypothetical protein
MKLPKPKFNTSLQNAPESADDIKMRNRELQLKVHNEGGAYFFKSDLENINFILRLEIEQAMKKILNSA